MDFEETWAVPYEVTLNRVEIGVAAAHVCSSKLHLGVLRNAQDPGYQLRRLPAMAPLTGPHRSSRTKERFL